MIRREERRWTDGQVTLLLIVTVAMVAVAGSLLLTLLTEDSGLSSSSVAAPSRSPWAGGTVAPSATYPPEIVGAAVALMTSVAPTPTETPEPYQPTTLPTVVTWCQDGLPDRTRCMWPPPPSPTVTPMPTCETPIPGNTCVFARLTREAAPSSISLPSQPRRTE